MIGTKQMRDALDAVSDAFRQHEKRQELPAKFHASQIVAVFGTAELKHGELIDYAEVYSSRWRHCFGYREYRLIGKSGKPMDAAEWVLRAATIDERRMLGYRTFGAAND